MNLAVPAGPDDLSQPPSVVPVSLVRHSAHRFTRRPPFKAGTAGQGWGASHYAELWYVFGHLDPAVADWTAADRRLADQIAGYWTRFAATGDPNGPGLPAWPRAWPVLTESGFPNRG
jgi:carboxylesterase type B